MCDFSGANLGLSQEDKLKGYKARLSKLLWEFNNFKNDAAEGIEFFYFNKNFYRNVNLSVKDACITGKEEEFFKSIGYKFFSDIFDIDGLEVKGLNSNFDVRNIRKISEAKKKLPIVMIDDVVSDNKIENYSYEKLFVLNNIAYFNVSTSGMFDICKNVSRNICKNESQRYVEYSELVYKSEPMRPLLEKYIRKIRTNFCCKPMSKAEFSDLFPINLSLSSFFSVFIDGLAKKSIIKFSDDGKIIIQPLTIWEWCYDLPDCTEKSILQLILAGCNQTEIGQRLSSISVTRQNISNKFTLLKEYLQSITFQEDKYIDIYERYSFTKQEFLEIFQVSEGIYKYIYLVSRAPEGNGDNSVEKIPCDLALKDDSISDEFKERIYNYFVENFVVVGDEGILRTRRDVIRFVLKNNCSGLINISDFLNKYNALLRKCNQEKNPNYIITDVRSFDNLIVGSGDVISVPGRTYKYYHFSDYDFDNFYKKIDFVSADSALQNLKASENIEIPAGKLFEKNIPLMNEYNLQSGYELHNLIKQTWEEYGASKFSNEFSLVAARNPTLKFSGACK